MNLHWRPPSSNLMKQDWEETIPHVTIQNHVVPLSLSYFCVFLCIFLLHLCMKKTLKKKVQWVKRLSFFHQNTSFTQCRTEKSSVNAGGQKSQKSIWLGFLSVSWYEPWYITISCNDGRRRYRSSGTKSSPYYTSYTTLFY